MTAPYDVQICTITGEPDPNFFSIYDQKFRPKKLYLLVTKAMEEKAEWFTQAVSGLVPEEGIIHKAVSSEDDPFGIERAYEEIFEETRKNNERVLVNITGGTKLFAISASTICEKCGIDYVYFSIGKNSFLCFSPAQWAKEGRSEKIPEHKVKVNANKEWLRRYLNAHGFGINESNGEYLDFWQEMTSVQRQFLDYVFKASNQPEFQAAVHMLNKLGEGTALTKTIWKPKDATEKEKDLIKQFIQEMCQLGMVEIRQKGMVTFSDKKAYEFFYSSHWFEHYTASLLMELGIRPFTTKLHQFPSTHKKESRDPINELDVVFFQEETLRLHVMEVKSGQQATKGKRAQEFLHKIKNVTTEMGGKGSKAAMVCLQNPNYDERAKKYGIEVFPGNEVINRENFKKHLEKWINNEQKES